ncbi:MAG: ankyrin repeat domain-containing protein [Gammaproteobacteria bacterium]
MPDHLHALPPGHMLGEYRIDRVLGSGGFGITYYAWDTHLDKPVAIKEYLPNEFAVRADATTVQPKSSGDRADYEWGLARFLDEARTLARFRHHHLNEVYRFFEGNGTAYMVLEYIDGETLSDILRRDGRLAPERLRRLLDELLTGLDEVHAAGYVHRDVKPGNIMLRADGSAVLLDFGAARQAIGQRSKSITAILTPGYAPIEQYEQNAEGIGPWTDLYAVGMVAYRCLSGISESELPDAVTRANWKRKGEHDRDLQSAVTVGEGAYDAGLLKAVDHAVEVYENDRPQSVGEMREVLLGGAAKSAAVAAVSSIPSPPSPPISTARRRIKAVIGGGMNIGWKRVTLMLLAVLLVGGGVAAGLSFALDWEAKVAVAMQHDRLAHILRRDVSPRAKDENGWTDLHYAAAADLSHVARLLIAAGADVNAWRKDDNAALSDSLKRNLRTLTGGTMFDDWISGSATPLHIAAAAGADKTAALLLQNGADIAAKDVYGGMPLHYAAKNNADKVATLLLKNGANIEAEDMITQTPLHFAAWVNADKATALLLKNGANIEAKNDGDWTPLHIAAWVNADKAAALLLKNGADVAARTNKDETPLHATAYGNADKTAALLLKNGASRYARDRDGETPLDVAKRKNSVEVIRLLQN